MASFSQGGGVLKKRSKTEGTRLKVGLGACGIAAGAMNVFEEARKTVEENDLPIRVERTGCIGMCHHEPLVEIEEKDGGRILLGEMTPEKIAPIIAQYMENGHIDPDNIVAGTDYITENDPFFSKQYRIVLSNCGTINPESIDEYRETGGYEGLARAIREIDPDEIIREVLDSGLRGRGGAGFPTGLKWKFTKQAAGSPKYVVCNADEGDPGAFMDRSTLEGDPHSVIEGMTIAAYAIGASDGYIYVRAEYPLAVSRLKTAIRQANEAGLLGEHILESDFSFDIRIKEGAGAFVCGEETALLASIEGERGLPRLRPPFPATKGLWGKPTNINNVETYASVSRIIQNGASWYSGFGTEKSKGTKVFALAGKIRKGGLIEVPMGITLKEIIYDIGGGIKEGKRFKAVQMGGPSGGCIPESLLDTTIDYDSVTKTGAIMGSGGMVVMDEETCMVEVARFFLEFTQNESCGKCTFCRIGTKRMLEILERITNGLGREDDIERLETLAQSVKSGSLCGLGQTAPNPVLTTLRYFRDEYEAHIKEKRCPAKQCRGLISYRILPEECVGCGVCLKNCPVDAIRGEKKQVHEIDPKKCIKCGICLDSCRFGAVEVR
ncbi:MAG: NADH-quinone oxidoreductase subunit NuoF [Spirochaetes bacterium]|nr:NADH-quinone oxidoreductase subunit NuoF [Spirochaetota bacterium]